MLEDEDILAHFGVKGMHWGVRRNSKGSSEPSSDAKVAKDALAKIKTHGGVHSLSNAELKTVVDRMNLEQQYSRLNPKTSPMTTGLKITREILNAGATVNQVISFTNSPAGKQLVSAMKK